jgi:hypothetical protein
VARRNAEMFKTTTCDEAYVPEAKNAETKVAKATAAAKAPAAQTGTPCKLQCSHRRYHEKRNSERRPCAVQRLRRGRQR